jgi:hypothetical protein
MISLIALIACRSQHTNRAFFLQSSAALVLQALSSTINGRGEISQLRFSSWRQAVSTMKAKHVRSR